MTIGFKAYLDEQFAAPVTNPTKNSNYPDLAFPAEDGTACPTSSPGDPNYNQTVCNRDNFSIYPLQRTYFSNALYGPDQLRQRVAFALHQIIGGFRKRRGQSTELDDDLPAGARPSCVW